MSIKAIGKWVAKQLQVKELYSPGICGFRGSEGWLCVSEESSSADLELKSTYIACGEQKAQLTDYGQG